MSFQPSTNLYIGAVDFDSSYKHYHYIDDRVAQQQHFASLCPMGLRRDDYTYQRLENAIVVPFNAETLYGYNYCMFQNENYGDRWFYSFITKIEYVNPSSSRLFLSLDIMQTWFPDVHVKPCMVEREHVNDDSIGAHLRDEGINPGEHIVDYYTYDNSNTGLFPVVASAAEPYKDGTYTNVAGGYYNGCVSGVSLTVFRNVADLIDFLSALAENGQQDAVAEIYMLPGFCVGQTTVKTDGWGEWINNNTQTPIANFNVNVGITSLNGYVPKNNKTLCYPNQYVELTNFNGINQQFRIEFFQNPGIISFVKRGGCLSSSELSYTAFGYNGFNESAAELTISLPQYPTCSWVYQTVANMVGRNQHRVSTPFGDFDINTTLLPALMPILSGITNAVGSLLNRDIGSALVAPSNAAMDVALNLTNLTNQLKAPNTQKGGLNSSTSLVNINAYTIGIRKYTCRYEFAKQIDDYYSQYGYLVSEIKNPNLTGRQSWNYVKTNGANVAGKVPADVLKAINTLLNNGITFWHTSDIGNYNLPNNII